MSNARERKYWAFISYCSKDARWATWLHRAIETYNIPATFIQHTTPSGDVAPRRLHPVFRDRDELPASADLGQVIESALANSRYLIVICSPNAARSRWVNREIELFHKLDRHAQVLALIVDGEPNSGTDLECFPPILQSCEPLCADARAEGDGANDAKLKLIAGMLGIGFDALKQRDAQRRIRILQRMLVAGLLLLTIFAALTWYSNDRRIAANSARVAEANAKNKAQQLAEKNARLAEDERLAKESETRAKLEAENLATKNAALAESEKEAKIEAQQSAKLAREEADRAMRSDYANRIALAETEIARGNTVRAATLLNDCPESMRHYEWHRLRLLSDTSLFALPGHDGLIISVAVSADGSRAVSLNSTNENADQTIRIWNTEYPGKQLHVLRSHTTNLFAKGAMTSIAISGDGRRVITGGLDQLVRVWDVESGVVLYTLKGHTGTVSSVACDMTGKIVAAASHAPNLLVWDAERDAEKPFLTIQQANKPHLTPDGKRLVAIGGQGNASCQLHLWDLDQATADLAKGPEKPPATGFATGHFPHPKVTLSGHQGNVTSLAISSDASRIISCASDDTVRLWDGVKGGDPLRIITGSGNVVEIADVAISSNGKIFGIAGTNRVKIYDNEDPHPKNTLLVGSVLCMAMDADGLRFVSGGGQKLLKVWDPGKSGEAQLRIRGGHFQFTPIAVNPDGSCIASGRWDNSIHVYEANNGELKFSLAGHSEEVTATTFSADGKRIVSGSRDATVRVWDVLDHAELLCLHGHGGMVNAVAISANGKTIASAGSFDHSVKTWNAEEPGPALRTIQGDDNFTAVALTADGKILATESFDRSVKIWDATTGKLLHTLAGHTQEVESVAFSSDGLRIASGGHDQMVRIWDAKAGGDPLLVLKGHDSWIKAVAWCCQDQRVISGGFDGNVKVWDANYGGEAFLTLGGHETMVHSLSMSADSRRLVTSSFGENIRVWDAQHPSN